MGDYVDMTQDIEEVAAPSETDAEDMEPTETADAAEENDQEAAEGDTGAAKDEKPKQSAEADRIAAEARRAMKRTEEKAAEAERRLHEAERKLSEYRTALKPYGYADDDTENIAKLIAAKEGGDVETIKRRLDAEAQQREQIINSDPRVQAAERYVREQEAALMAQKDLLEIKQAFPQETATNVEKIKNVEAFNKYRFHFDEHGNAVGIRNSAVEAYKLANLDELSKKPKQKPNDKEHMIPAGGTAGNSGLINIPADEVEVWKEAYPDEPMAKLRERYNRVLKLQEET